ncbi:hypothetical protein MCOR27_011457 [Pyricularia oryzae]|uniref:DNA/RNA-binding domain-containing protein n=2 Tax=Pyricularia TaxID=48558 RepID=A0ABQ8NNN9_PYRGI|nr:hypothetical protein MCOR27_011457 [Pyricularia oryzae]KAI6299884.1 hypothetical protein MCOR33_004272 [Pyricularia grisea]KAI6311169.1 hypothetical protein MCOR29_008353 [Pyricularia oryzae]KAI6314620.1 hypothetical protein MCOR34_004906 [Pyricularia oryzae]KAI6361695.1 hypothetical protein MCOR32_008611 [Pyricularia oryzae]
MTNKNGDANPPVADIGQRFTKYLREKSQPSDRKPVDSEPKKPMIEVPSKSETSIQQSPPSQEPASPTTNASPKPRGTPSTAQATTATATPQRSRAKGPATDPNHGFDPVPRARKPLWQDGTPGMTKQQAAVGALTTHSRGTTTNNARLTPVPGQPRRASSSKGGSGGSDATGEIDEVNKLVKQPETRPIGQEQLVAEVKGIYAGLVMVENKCIEVDNAQNSLNNDSASPKLNTDQWQALIALHRTLLHEHHDFFLASQHPSASPALRRLAAKYAMPARMWRHGIHSFLELLRHRLPHSLEYMLTFIYSSYSMMALLYETVPAFEYTWIECLGDLSRYRMAIEDDDVRDREVWTAVSRQWYSRASDKAPTTGRLYHHLAILARPNVVAQLFYYAKSLCVPIPFNSARDSILTLFEPIMAGTHGKLHAVDRALVRCHGTFFTGKGAEDLEEARDEFLSNLDLAVAKGARRWLEAGYQIAVTNLCALFGYGLPANVLMRALDASTREAPMPKIVVADEATSAESQAASSETQKSSKTDDENGPAATTEAKEDVVDPLKHFKQVLQFVESTDTIVLSRLGDLNILSYAIVKLTFLLAMARLKGPGGGEPITPAMSHLEASFPWHLLCLCLNSFAAGFETPEKYETTEFPRTAEGRPLPEDWAMRGLVWADPAEVVFPPEYFAVNESMEEDERTFETPSMGEQRRERCLWLAYQIAQIGTSGDDADDKGKEGRWITYDADNKKFRPAAKYVSDVEIRPPVAKATVLDDEDVLPEAELACISSGPEGSLGAFSVQEQKNEKPTIIQSSDKVQDSNS